MLLLGIAGFVVNMATTFQDVAVDGMAVDVMEEGEHARASGMMFGGRRSGSPPPPPYRVSRSRGSAPRRRSLVRKPHRRSHAPYAAGHGARRRAAGAVECR